MEHRYIGKSGLRVSPICLGTMTFGHQCSKDTAFRLMDMAYDHGVNFFDTAEIYPAPPQAERVGITEEIVGANSEEQLQESLAAMDVQLGEDVLEQCGQIHKEILYPMG